LVFVQISFSQTEKLIQGQVLSNDFAVQDVKIINLNTEKSSISNSNGVFTILAKPDDLLVFYAQEYQYKRKQLAEKDFLDTNFIVRLEKKPIELKEVVIEKPTITAESLGIVSGKQKSYTPAERRLAEANSGILTRLLNLASGRTTMLNRNLIVEKNERLLKKTAILFEEDYYTKILKIDKDYIAAFQYYLIENKEFETALKSKNRTMIQFLMSKLAVDFNQLIVNENH
jgi:hypothetical protein